MLQISAVLPEPDKTALQGEIGDIFHPHCADARYATDAVRMMLGYEVICCGVQRIFAWLDPANTSWGGVVESMRLRRGTHLLQNDCFGGSRGNELIHALLTPAWQVPQDL
ncbi:acetyltransferase [Rhodovulum sulfidophilum]|uniref:Acetyltransferase n=1 Tax=Rhodovulum sulfidophilum TaxID=35806 RepID=A0A0D6B335_RHOSU|nr:acetyltransferase [Rhodovulum sulfidophilum]